MSPALDAFLKTWRGSAGNERANFQSFLRDFCAALELPVPEPKGVESTHCFEKDLKLTHLDGTTSTGSIDLYREDCFVLEAKQGSTTDVPGSAPRRGTRAYDRYMEAAFGQAVNYARNLPQRPPFVITCDIGHAFHVWDGFAGAYGGYGARRSFTMDDLRTPKVQEYFRALWLDPQSLDPARSRTAVTRDVAAALGGLAHSLEARFPAEVVARFLMRVVFTFFAEDVSLLPEKLFQNALEGAWKEHPEAFPKGMESLWDAMNTGGFWGPLKVLRFNGGLFSESLALDLNADEIARLAKAAAFNWAEVDPSIFGTLLESALDARERHRLGAHYTPRAYVERLLRPALEEPLRADWELAQAEAMALLGAEATDADKAKAREVLHDFQRHLAHVKVLDPACGSGNFLATAYDVLKRLEGEVQRRLEDLGETGRSLALEGVLVTPAQFVGLEVKPWAAAITDLVLWISHLQWFHRLHPDLAPPEPVLQAYGNIQCRDAVLTWTGTRATGRSRWDGQTFKTHPVTGKDVPDEAAQTAIVEYLEPEPASWPEADFIVGNPPFLGNARMRDALGDGYAEALRAAYPDVPDTVDFVLYWWHKAAEAVRSGRTRRFGLITTNSLRQVRQRGVIAHHTTGKKPLKLLWVIPDHPWTDEGAAVRIAMTVGGMEGHPWLGRVVEEGSGDTPEIEAQTVKVEGQGVDLINEDLSQGANLTQAQPLKANSSLCSRGMELRGKGFIVTPETWNSWGQPAVVHHYRNGRDLTDTPRGVMVIDLFGLRESQIRERYPSIYQHVVDNVKPEREQNNRAASRDGWWLYGEARSTFRPALVGLRRFIAVPHIAKYRAYQFLDAGVIPDNMLIAFAFDDAWVLGVLQSSIHEKWTLVSGGTLEDRPIYYKSRCFDPFPFPNATEPQKARIRDLAERLDAHRKAAQGRGVTITGMYNLLAKLRSGEAFTAKEREQHEAAQTEILRQLHDELDEAVIEAYGWNQDQGNHRCTPMNTDNSLENHSLIGVHRSSSVANPSLPSAALSDAEILERLVALNKERAAEEARGLVRWLRPEYQAPEAAQAAAKPMLEEERALASEANVPLALEPQPWPKGLKDQLAALRAVLLASARLWTLEDVAKTFKSKGRYRDSITAHLDLLTDLGMLSRVETPEGPRWHRPQALGA
ncbi:DNA methyltransferase [Geothrix fuzhouensis]|uniref:DNA methyltransferase n=1 Tax=Geothrix fuzhouensis TaxID=2966451 RepID=UPI0021491995|nr:DNA methyltransferase [Geothrix fuzhouensis]